MAHYISEGFTFFHSLAFNDQKNAFIKAIEPYPNPTFSREVLGACRSLPVQAFAVLFYIIEKDIKKSDLFYKLLEYQTSFSEAFSAASIEQYFSKNSTVTREDFSETGLSEDCEILMRTLVYEDWDLPFYEEIPIYSYNSIKNYADDLFYLLLKENPGCIDDKALQEFQQTDFKQVIEAQIEATDLDEIHKLIAFFQANKGKIIETLFEENCRKLRIAKYEIIGKIPSIDAENNAKQRLTKILLDLDVKSLPSFNFGTSRALVNALKTYNLPKSNEKKEFIIPKNFISELELFEELGSLEMLMLRIQRFANMVSLFQEDALTKDDDYIKGLNRLTFLLLRLVSL